MRKSLGRNVSRGRRDSLQPANGEVFRLVGSLYPKRRVLSDDCKRGWICRLEGGENPTTVETLTCTSRDFKMPRRPRRQERQKSNRLNRQNNNCITLFCTFLCRHCTTTTGKCLSSRFMEVLNKRRLKFLSRSELEYDS